MHPHERVADLAAGVSFFEHVWDRVKISERLLHFLSVDQQMGAVRPYAHEFFAGDAFALRDLGFVMRENIVSPAAMNIYLFTEQRRRHCAALDVPAGPPGSPGRIPF